MIEGWHGDNYLVLFQDAEVASACLRYRIDEYLPGYQVIGLRGWDDLIVRDTAGHAFSVPVVPLDRSYLVPFQMPPLTVQLQADDRFTGRIKWYIKPVVFGGDAAVGENLSWVDHEQHGQLAIWWNKMYRDLASKG